MKYLKTWETYKNTKSINESTELILDKNSIKSDINKQLKEEFPDCILEAYFITTDEHETRMSVYIKKINFIPYTDRYIDAIKNNNYSEKFGDYPKYNPQYYELKDEISNIIVLNDLDFFDLVLSPFCKSNLETKLKNYEQIDEKNV